MSCDIIFLSTKRGWWWGLSDMFHILQRNLLLMYAVANSELYFNVKIVLACAWLNDLNMHDLRIYYVCQNSSSSGGFKRVKVV